MRCNLPMTTVLVDRPEILGELHYIDYSASMCYSDLCTYKNTKNTMEKLETASKSIRLPYDKIDSVGVIAQGANGEVEHSFTFSEAHDYIESIRQAYRDGAEYKGERSEVQRRREDKAELEADTYIFDLIHSLGAAPAAFDARVGTLQGDQGLGLEEMYRSWKHLWMGLNVIAERIHRKDSSVKDLAEYSAEERLVVMQQLFNDFQEHNAMRFGAEGMGIQKTRPKLGRDGLPMEDDNGKLVMETYDPDRARNSH